MNHIKGVGEPIKTKDIFDFIYSHGYIRNPSYAAGDVADDAGIDDDGISSVTGGTGAIKRATDYQFYATCVTSVASQQVRTTRSLNMKTLWTMP
jgi:hypothetical protein